MFRRNSRRRARRNFGTIRRHRARRNAWDEAKTFSVTRKVAPGHRAAALKGWASRGGSKSVVVVAAPAKTKAAPAKTKATPKRKKRSGSKRSVARRPKGDKKTRKNSRSRRRRVVFLKRNPRRRRHARRNPILRHRSHRRNARRMHRRSRRNGRRSYRRNGAMDILMKGALVVGGVAAAAFLGGKLSEYVADQVPAQLKQYTPALVTGVAAVGLFMVGKKLNLSEKVLNGLMYGGMAAVGVQLLLNVKIPSLTGDKSLAQMLKIGWTGVHTEAPAPVAAQAATGGQTAAAAGYGMFGLGAAPSNYGMFGVHGYNPMQLSGAVDIDGRALAVEGVVSVPGGGALAVDGLGGYFGGTLSDSVFGTQRASDGPAVNPFSAGVREGNRGTLNEPTAGEFDMGSLNGNIFS